MNEQVNIRTHDVLIEDEKISHSTGIAKSIFDILLKPQHQDIDPWNAYRPRVFVSAIISLILAIIFFNLLYLMSGFQPSEFHRVVVITALLSLLTIYLYYRFGGDFNIASHLFIFTSTVILGCFIWMTGGFISPILYLLALIPFMALVLGHNKSGYFWVFVSITIYVGFYIIKAKGLASHLTINDKYLDFAQVFGWITLTSCIVMGLVVYRRASENTTKQLHSFGQSLARKAEVDP
ncbi:MAG: hypothetical protein OEY19_01720, partial [Gammaproteobacteria bacterium]|nr:hypothetical protein [Gammaproteobacteria bacterium]